MWSLTTQPIICLDRDLRRVRLIWWDSWCIQLLSHTHAAAILFAFSTIKSDCFFVTLSRICVSFTALTVLIVVLFKFEIYKESSTSSTFLSWSDIFSWDFKKSSRIGYDSLFLRPVDDIRSILGEDQGRRQLSVKHEDVSWPDSLHMPSSSQHHIATRLPTLLSRQQRKKLDPTTYPTQRDTVDQDPTEATR